MKINIKQGRGRVYAANKLNSTGVDAWNERPNTRTRYWPEFMPRLKAHESSIRVSRVTAVTLLVVFRVPTVATLVGGSYIFCRRVASQTTKRPKRRTFVIVALICVHLSTCCSRNFITGCVRNRYYKLYQFSFAISVIVQFSRKVVT